MRFAFNERKSAQAMAHLLTRHRGHMNYMVAVKVLYLADRMSLIETGRPITGDWMASLPLGPVLSITLNLIRSPSDDRETVWHEYITKHWRWSIKLAKAHPDHDELSAFELETIVAADKEIGWMDHRQVSKYSHEKWKEWKDPHGSSQSIQPEDILAAANKSAEVIEHASRMARDLWRFESRSRTGRRA